MDVSKSYFSFAAPWLGSVLSLMVLALMVLPGCTLQPVSQGAWGQKRPHKKFQLPSRFVGMTAREPAPVQAGEDGWPGRLPDEEFTALMPYLQGDASWYGPDFHGKKTANGEVYNQFAFTAAHRALPMGTRIKVRNLANNRTVMVRINDRGPYKKGRILDLSRSAAKMLRMIGTGIAPVKITVLRWPSDMDFSLGLKPYRQFVVQMAAYPNRRGAERHKDRLQQDFEQVAFVVDPLPHGPFAVVAGPYEDEFSARRVATRLKKKGIANLVRSYRK